MKEKEMSIQTSREEENGDEHNKRDSPTPPRTYTSNNGGREEKKNNNLDKSKTEIKSTQRKLKSVGKKKTNTRFILVRQQPMPTSSPQATNGS